MMNSIKYFIDLVADIQQYVFFKLNTFFYINICLTDSSNHFVSFRLINIT